MRIRVRSATRLVIVAGCLCLVWLLAIHSWKPVPATAPATAPEQKPDPMVATAGNLHPTAPSFAVNVAAATPDPGEAVSDEMLEDSGVEVPAVESSWARELRELKELAARRPAEALAQIGQISDREEREAATKEVCLQLASDDPELAAKAAWRLELARDGAIAGRDALEKLARLWATADFSAALAWASEQPADEDGRRDQIMKGIVSVLSQSAPADAARLVAEQMPPDHGQFEAAMDVVREWAARDFAAAAAWVELFPEGPVRNRGRAELANVPSSRQQPEASAN